MERVSTSGAWALLVLFAFAAATVGFGCAEAACARTCAGEPLPVAQATAAQQPVSASEALRAESPSVAGRSGGRGNASGLAPMAIDSQWPVTARPLRI